MRAFMIGMVAIGLLAGIAVGRTSERARRGYKDYGAAKTAVGTGRKVAFTGIRKAATTMIVVGFVLFALFMGAANLPK